MRARFELDGYVIIDSVLSESEVQALSQRVSEILLDRAGTRNVLLLSWCQELAKVIKESPSIKSLLPRSAVAVQCTYFYKTPERNWLVALHRDRFIPVKERIEVEGWSNWSQKEGIHYVCPPINVLKSSIAIRLHLEDNTHENGALLVVPGSHKNLECDGETVACYVSKGGIVAMKPLTLHASSKLLSGNRRVLHYLFAPLQLPDNMEWHTAI
jgi:hypothetical protein